MPPRLPKSLVFSHTNDPRCGRCQPAADCCFAKMTMPLQSRRPPPGAAAHPGRPMAQDTRQQQILELVRQRGFMSIEALAEHFSVTPQTVRRDINQLCDRERSEEHTSE